MVRRLFAVVAAMALIASLTMSSVFAAASPQGVLRAAFQSYWTGGDGVGAATWVHGAQAYFHAANTGIDLGQGAVRIGLSSTQEYCASNLFGIWVLAADTDKAGLANSTWHESFGPAGGTQTPLAMQRTAVKRAVDPQGVWWGGDPYWWQSIGVAVYGSLAPGVYEFQGSYLWNGEYFEWDIPIRIDAC